MGSVYITEPPTRGKVLVRTSAGELDVELWPKEAPRACRNFVQLCMEGYYDDTVFHRVCTNKFIQGGDPTGTGTGGESIFGRLFEDELHTRLRFSHRGIVAMASMDGPNTNGSQFFVTFDKAEWLDRKHTIFGKITGDTIYNLVNMNTAEVDENDRPTYPVRILGTEVLENPFDDIQPREEVVVARRAAKEAAAAAAAGGKKKPTRPAVKYAMQVRSAHDVLTDDKRLAREAAAAASASKAPGGSNEGGGDASEDAKAESLRKRVRLQQALSQQKQEQLAARAAGADGDADGDDDDDDDDDEAANRAFDAQMRDRVLQTKNAFVQQREQARAEEEAKAEAAARDARDDEYRRLKREVLGKSSDAPDGANGTGAGKGAGSVLERMRAKFTGARAPLTVGARRDRQDDTLRKLNVFSERLATGSLQTQRNTHLQRQQEVNEAEEAAAAAAQRALEKEMAEEDEEEVRAARSRDAAAAAAATSRVEEAEGEMKIVPPELLPTDDDDGVDVNDPSWRARPLHFRNRVSDPVLRAQTDVDMYEVYDPLVDGAKPPPSARTFGTGAGAGAAPRVRDDRRGLPSHERGRERERVPVDVRRR